MKKFSALLRNPLSFSAATLLSLHIPDANSCTVASWNTLDYGVFITRTVDWMESTQPTLEIRAKGNRYQGGEKGEKTLIWTSKYASLGATLYGMGFIQAFNEAGLSVNALFLDEESTTQYNASKYQLENKHIVAYLVDNFSSVADAVRKITTIQLQLSNINGKPLTGHYALQDSRGDAAIIEYIDGQWKIYHGKEHQLMTNSPVYSRHLDNWEKAKPLNKAIISGEFSIPGNISSEQRYIRSRYMLEQLKQPTSTINGIIKIDSITPKVPLDAANRKLGNQMMTYATEYSMSYNLNEKIIYIRYQYNDTYTHYSIDFNRLNNGKNYTMRIDLPDLFGDVTERLKIQKTNDNPSKSVMKAL